MDQQPSHVIASQDASHGPGHDYEPGSPHLRHRVLRAMIDERLTALVGETLARQGSCHVLEIGAGHGTFTDVLLRAGATVTVTEASRASAAQLRDRYAAEDRVSVVFDESGEDVLSTQVRPDAVVCASLLHHIPDYLSFVRGLAALLSPGGWFYSVQDPTWYPRRSRWVHWAGRGTYMLWRLGQGNVRRGLATRWRRVRGTYSEQAPSDLVEYHVMRQGVDEVALERELRPLFDDVEVFLYWSTQAPLLQRALQRWNPATDFGIVARGRRA